VLGTNTGLYINQDRVSKKENNIDEMLYEDKLCLSDEESEKTD